MPNTIEYPPLGRSGLRVSRLSLGAMNFGDENFGCDEQTSLAIIRAYLEAGLNFIDTADVYAGTRSETIVGKAIKGRRDSVVLATKAAAPLASGPHERGGSRKHLMKAIEESLRRLDTDYIDLYQMHAYDQETPLEETLSTLDDLVRQGKVRYLGVSNWSASQIVEAALICQMRGWERLISLQAHYNILVRDIEVEIVPSCRKFGLGIISWSPLAGGMLTGKYARGQAPAADTRFGAASSFQEIWRRRNLNERNFDIVSVVVEEAAKLHLAPTTVSLVWNLTRPGVVAPIIGPKSVKQLEENLAALHIDLPNETLERIDAVSAPHVGYPHDFSITRGREG